MKHDVEKNKAIRAKSNGVKNSNQSKSEEKNLAVKAIRVDVELQTDLKNSVVTRKSAAEKSLKKSDLSSGAVKNISLKLTDETVAPLKKNKSLKANSDISAAKAELPIVEPTAIVNINSMPPKLTKIEAAIEKIVRANELKIERQKAKCSALPENLPFRESEISEPPIENSGDATLKPKKKKTKTLGAAIFRGKKERYDFQVFPIDGEFEDAAAIYVVSSRKIDKNKRAHHKMVCIGQSNSILDELKKHRKGKCFKQHQVNAVSVLREENEQKRLKIEADLKSAHSIPCPHA